MKTIIYSGIALLSAASVYGVADYLHTEKQGQLKNLYAAEEELPPTATTPSEKTAVAAVPVVPSTKKEKTTRVVKTTKPINKTPWLKPQRVKTSVVKKSDSDVPSLEEPVIAREIVVPDNSIEKTTNVVTTQPATPVAAPVVEVKAERRLDLSRFSRKAAIPIKRVKTKE